MRSAVNGVPFGVRWFKSISSHLHILLFGIFLFQFIHSTIILFFYTFVMITTLLKSALRDGYYYSGYILQNYTVIATNQPQIVCMWNAADRCFYFWEFENNRKTKSRIPYLNDLDSLDEISIGFYPVKEIIPKSEHIIE